MNQPNDRFVSPGRSRSLLGSSRMRSRFWTPLVAYQHGTAPPWVDYRRPTHPESTLQKGGCVIPHDATWPATLARTERRSASSRRAGWSSSGKSTEANMAASCDPDNTLFLSHNSCEPQIGRLVPRRRQILRPLNTWGPAGKHLTNPAASRRSE